MGDTSDTRDFIWVDSAAATGGGVRFRNTANANAAVCASLTALRGQISEVTDSAAAAADSGDSVTVGKATGKDAAAGKATQIGLLGVEAARGRSS